MGRDPNLELSFSKAGVEISPQGIKVNRRMETTAPGIYAIGDAIEGIMLAHVAMEQGIVAAENAIGMDQEMKDNPIPLCIFTHPEVASVGFTEKEAKAKGEIKIGRFPFRSNPKAVISGETDGLIKVIASRENDTIVGVHIIGPEASVLLSIASTKRVWTIHSSTSHDSGSIEGGMPRCGWIGDSSPETAPTSKKRIEQRA